MRVHECMMIVEKAMWHWPNLGKIWIVQEGWRNSLLVLVRAFVVVSSKVEVVEYRERQY